MSSSLAQSPRTSRPRYAPQMSTVPEELVADILSRLRVKTLMRLKCVSKPWNSLISNPNFAKLHLQKSARDPHLTLMWEHPPSSYKDFYDGYISVVPFPLQRLLENPSLTIAKDHDFRFQHKDCDQVVGSCDGLLCLVGYSGAGYSLRLWNPATRVRSRELAFFGIPVTPPRSSVFKFAVGYDNLTGTYKVVVAEFFIDDPEIPLESMVRVYSTGGKGWRDIESFPVVPVHPLRIGLNDGAYLNGTLNWLAVCDSPVDYDWDVVTADQLVVLSLDLGKETYNQLLLPRGFEEVPRVEPSIGVFMDCMCFSYDFKRTHFVLWLMKEFGVRESWTQFLRVSYQDLQLDQLQYQFRLLPLWVSEDDDVLVMAKGSDAQAILYNWRENTLGFALLKLLISEGHLFCLLYRSAT
ncbi:hypothetical protein VNO77_19579 [Canavalia gladiata]|uniref:F-box domain-containing protein n=1 Tax=Canavalia gladiata TaxID=3824 RepID=A0AAN9QIM2_CANGL